MANDNLTRFAYRVVWIIKDTSEWIAENGPSLIKTDPVFPQILRSLLLIPLKMKTRITDSLRSLACNGLYHLNF